MTIEERCNEAKELIKTGISFNAAMKQVHMHPDTYKKWAKGSKTKTKKSKKSHTFMEFETAPEVKTSGLEELKNLYQGPDRAQVTIVRCSINNLKSVLRELQ